jgi:hypothetical protein
MGSGQHSDVRAVEVEACCSKLSLVLYMQGYIHYIDYPARDSASDVHPASGSISLVIDIYLLNVQIGLEAGPRTKNEGGARGTEIRSRVQKGHSWGAWHVRGPPKFQASIGLFAVPVATVLQVPCNVKGQKDRTINSSLPVKHSQNTMIFEAKEKGIHD